MQPLKTVSIIQARMASSRLPGKVLLDIAGQPMLAWVVERARRAKTVDQVVVATTTDPADDAVEGFCNERGYPYVRGSLHDVLDRCYQAARAFGAQVIARLTADCPLIDPDLIDETVRAVQREHYDFAANRLPPPWKRTYPIGLDVEVCTFGALERAWKEADQPHQREHVMPFLYENEPVVDSRTLRVIDLEIDLANRRGFKVLLLNHDPDYGALRWTVDTPEDLELIRQIIPRLGSRNDFSWFNVLALFEREPDLALINAGVQHKGFRDVDQRSVKRDL
jgi:spore coat polysaccharide biosynthesis protein SpsF